YPRNQEGKSYSEMTSYHPNGQVCQYLEAVDGRAHGLYREWHQNGQLKIDAYVIEGVADITETAQRSWLFDKLCRVFDEEGHLIAEIAYERGQLENPSLYYHPNGQLAESVPYHQNLIHGTVCKFDEQGELKEKTSYQNGVKNGESIAFWKKEELAFFENYQQGSLQTGRYYCPQGEIVSEVHQGNGFKAVFEENLLRSSIQIQNGAEEGEVHLFDEKGFVQCSYWVKEGKKNGEEWEYYPKNTQEAPPRPKLFLHWQDDVIQGVVKTWYENGHLESQKEMNGNKKNGLSFAWYKEGELMFSEEYEEDRLIRGSYFKKGEKTPVSKIEEGQGIASLFDANGYFLKKITYEKGQPLPK
ncbi:MAG: toxin-antitoxin system YwqK family antitoxin, partial [Anaerolineae bacterium]